MAVEALRPLPLYMHCIDYYSIHLAVSFFRFDRCAVICMNRMIIKQSRAKAKIPTRCLVQYFNSNHKSQHFIPLYKHIYIHSQGGTCLPYSHRQRQDPQRNGSRHSNPPQTGSHQPTRRKSPSSSEARRAN